jgi:hypothetical protein
MHMYGPTFTQNTLQSCFYTLYNAEVDSTVHALTNLPLAAMKEHKKALPKSARVYLLDKLELNSKSRCVFAWSGTSSHFTCSHEYVDMYAACFMSLHRP